MLIEWIECVRRLVDGCVIGYIDRMFLDCGIMSVDRVFYIRCVLIECVI